MGRLRPWWHLLPPLGVLRDAPLPPRGRGTSDAEAEARGRATAPSPPWPCRLQPDPPTHLLHPQFRNPKASLRMRLCDLLGHLQRSGERDCQEFYRALYIHAQPLHSRLPSRLAPQNSDCTELDSGTAGHGLSDRGPVAFLACLGLAAGLALLTYCCPPDPKVLPGARRVLGFSPIIVDGHVSRFLLAFLTDELRGL
uniref:Caspase recruitment domain family member 19 n=1 Tax=Suricata suricatta TaxID=37032 RepID=A0A673UDE4_SURSU